mmetsp:Transcript_16912/g.31558  ORF Transcript_16912/g.31558 Transcript_16912/m.31558 type:complete len:132 (+) Transcript_16912:93-488(+)
MASKRPGAKSTETITNKDTSKKGKIQQKDDDGEFLIAAAFQHNTRTLGHSRMLSGIVAGCIAGLLRFEGLSGLCVFVAVTVLHSVIIFAKMGFNVTRHFPRTRDIFLHQFTHGLMSFILFWTLAFDTVHIF